MEAIPTPTDSARSHEGPFRLVRVIQELSLARDPSTIQAIVRTAARQLTGADGATFILRDGDQCYYADEDAIAPLWKGRRFPINLCVSGWAMTHRQAVVIPDIHQDDRVPQDAYRSTFVKSLLLVPIRTADPIGAIGTYWKVPHVPAPEEIQLLQALADSTSIAMENVGLYEELESRVRLRTAELEQANAAIRRQLDELLAANERCDCIFAALAENLQGTTLDEKFRLDEQIGFGGFGVVFRATWLTESRNIAVKVFQPQPGNDSIDASQRFLREGAWASRVRHPNAVEVYEYGVSDNGIPYLVMELLEGHTLTEELRRTGPLSPERCAAILGPVCAALGEAHAQGITHRDVKPDNIFLHRTQGSEVPKLLDFGLAKRSDPDTGELLRHSLQARAPQFTRTGQVIGTPLYIAPERWLGSTGAPGDIYSLGVVFYLMLCGLDVGNRMQTGFLQGNPFGPCGPRTWPPVAQFRADVPMPVEEILQGMLHSDPRARPSLDRVRWALETFAGSEMTA